MRALQRRSAPWLKAAALGAVVGSRSMLLPALVSRTTRRGNARRVWPLLAALEIAADKTPWIPSRTAPLSLTGRVLTGSAVASGMASARHSWPDRSTPSKRIGLALVGGSFAVLSAFLLRALRARAGGRNRPANVLVGLLEDLVAFGAGRALTRA